MQMTKPWVKTYSGGKPNYTQPIEQEPVAVFRREILGRGQIFWLRSLNELPNETLLYTATPQREWVGLTDDEIDDIWAEFNDGYGIIEETLWGYERAIEAKLKEKNGG